MVTRFITRGGFISTLVFDELVTELNQEIVIGNQNGLYSPIVIPWLYFHNNPAGTFKLGVYKDNVLVVEKSFTVSDFYTQLNQTGTTGHLWYRAHFDGVKLPFGFYVLKLSATGYTFSSSSFLAWCKDWESKYDANPNLDSVEWTQWPLAVRLLTLSNREI